MNTDNTENIVKIQSVIRGFLQRKRILIPSSRFQTKKWRKSRVWYHNGKKCECEKYQRALIEKIINGKCNKTNERINMNTYELKSLNYPCKYDNGFEWTEDFDGKNGNFYYNLKFVCDKGGAQTRSLREVYHFIKAQLNYLTDPQNEKKGFINILDGDTSYYYMSKFRYLVNNEKYKNVKKYIFVGDLNEFQDWFISLDSK